MPPKKRKAEKAVAVAPASPAKGLRSSERVTRTSAKLSGGSPKFFELSDTTRKATNKPKKAKKEGEGASAEGESSGNVPEASNRTIVVIEHCKQCNSFKTRANQVKEGLQKSALGITVKVNPEKPRKGCFEIRLEEGQKFISLLDLKRPFQPMKDLDMGKVVSDIIDKISNPS